MAEYIVNSSALRHERRTYQRGDEVELDKQTADKLGDAVLTKSQFERRGTQQQSEAGSGEQQQTGSESTGTRSKRGQ